MSDIVIGRVPFTDGIDRDVTSLAHRLAETVRSGACGTLAPSLAPALTNAGEAR